jgi:hypothetical protein
MLPGPAATSRRAFTRRSFRLAFLCRAGPRRRGFAASGQAGACNCLQLDPSPDPALRLAVLISSLTPQQPVTGSVLCFKQRASGPLHSIPLIEPGDSNVGQDSDCDSSVHGAAGRLRCRCRRQGRLLQGESSFLCQRAIVLPDQLLSEGPRLLRQGPGLLQRRCGLLQAGSGLL